MLHIFTVDAPLCSQSHCDQAVLVNGHFLQGEMRVDVFENKPPITLVPELARLLSE